MQYTKMRHRSAKMRQVSALMRKGSARIRQGSAKWSQMENSINSLRTFVLFEHYLLVFQLR